MEGKQVKNNQQIASPQQMVSTENSSHTEIPYVGPKRAARVPGSREKLLNAVLGEISAEGSTAKVGE